MKYIRILYRCAPPFIAVANLIVRISIRRPETDDVLLTTTRSLIFESSKFSVLLLRHDATKFHQTHYRLFQYLSTSNSLYRLAIEITLFFIIWSMNRYQYRFYNTEILPENFPCEFFHDKLSKLVNRSSSTSYTLRKKVGEKKKAISGTARNLSPLQEEPERVDLPRRNV